ncbi:FAD-dependent oxidoreductase [Pseudooceanicola sediminis]|uniref:FAD-dependent oxidoreductase n=1 Tax=Pseudooceanicola sediminis TaxID=2211117 RepID=A0A399J3C9_9RHOB|nr:GMC family oxidoreductase N-terminal domain-containing protein [Pseudooceanicola sediminis]KAA2312406.1 FAD-dependent oxidoreductase [Puniceibacterium sp. HSS470]RII37456.1 FAD-dependent oxidoreductase [Pseudooceanicola sediminis]|tara:strand:- start:22478 stop:24118 length:1641 start_codon:yes stop_codon:yes gene_type:complete
MVQESTKGHGPADVRHDFVIVGGGAAGCVLANRLSASGRHRVLLVEAGGKTRGPWFEIPAGIYYLLSNPKYLWLYRALATEAYGGRETVMMQGRGLGGGSAINGMLYMRGQREDYDLWAQMGCTGWDWNGVLPYFRKSERLDIGGAEGAHGRDGPLRLSWIKDLHDTSWDFLRAAQEYGLPFNPDVNSGDQDGVGHLLATIWKGRRQSTDKAFLRPAMGRENLEVLTGAEALSLTFDGRRATGVRLRDAQGKEQIVRAGREVVLAAGALGSAALLQRSGIGAPDHLAQLGITPVIAAPEVGENIQDHLFAHLKFATNSTSDSHNRVLSSTPRMGLEALRWILTRKGALNMPTSQVTGFIRSSATARRADLQLSMRPLSFHLTPSGLKIDDFAAITVSAIQTRPYSRGRYRITGPDAVKGTLDMGYLSDPRDAEILAQGMLRIRQIMTQPAIAHRLREEVEPGPGVASIEALQAHLRGAASTVYHPVGTCRMGGDDGAVVDPALRVRGVAGLRVADSSVMPVIPSGNTNAPSIMIAEKGADLILADT